MNRVDSALMMALNGWRVFPLVEGSKVPKAGGGVSVATTDFGQIRAWFEDDPAMNYGVATTGAVVLDVDRKGGRDGFRAYGQAFGGPPPATLTVRTPSGGAHYYYTDMHAGQAELVPGVDVRSDGGYVVGPGCETPEGVYRVARDVDAVPCPDIIKRRLAAPRGRKGLQPVGELDTPDALARGVHYLLHEAPHGEDGARDNTGYKVACALKDFGLSPSAIMDLMLQHWTWDEHGRTPFGEHDIERLANQSHRCGQLAPGATAPANEFDDVSDPLDAIEQSDQDAKREAIAKRWVDHFDASDVDSINALPPRVWYVRDLIAPGKITGIIAAPGIGKSLFSIALCAGLAAGDLSHLGFEAPHGRIRAMVVSMEEDYSDLAKRYAAATEALGLVPRMLKGYFNIQPPEPQIFRIVDRDESGRFALTKYGAELFIACEVRGIQCLVIDPWISAHGAKENDNEEIQAVVNILRNEAIRLKMGLVIVHHSRKTIAGAPDLAGSGDMARGAGAFFGALRSAATLSRLSDDEIAALGLSDAEAAGIIRFDRAKGTHSPAEPETRYFRKISVPRPYGDTEGAIVPYALDERMDEMRRAYADLIGAEMVASDQTFCTLKAAIAAVKYDPMFASLSDASLKRTLETMFAKRVVVVDGHILRMGAVANGTRGFILSEAAGREQHDEEDEAPGPTAH